MQFPTARILIFAKAPIPGQVKTRLLPLLSAEDAARLHGDLVSQTVQRVQVSALAPLQLWCAPGVDAPLFDNLKQTCNLELCQQRGVDLGARLLHAFTVALQCAEYTLAIGTDWPALQPTILAAALQSLQHGDDAVLGPAEDGGYVLLGLRRVDAHLFANITWGSSQVLTQTRARLLGLQWQWSELPMSWDLDRPSDFERALRAGLVLDPRTTRPRD